MHCLCGRYCADEIARCIGLAVAFLDRVAEYAADFAA
jgi:hypothetical protein